MIPWQFKLTSLRLRAHESSQHALDDISDWTSLCREAYLQQDYLACKEILLAGLEVCVAGSSELLLCAMILNLEGALPCYADNGHIQKILEILSELKVPIASKEQTQWIEERESVLREDIAELGRRKNNLPSNYRAPHYG